LEQSHRQRTTASVEPEDMSATRIFTRGGTETAADFATQPGVDGAPLGMRQDNIVPAVPETSQHSPPSQPTGGPAGATGTTREQLRDVTAFAKAEMRTGSFVDEHTHIQPGDGSDALNEAALQIIERQLAAYIGPLAKVYVRRAAGKTTSAVELYQTLAANLEKEEDRRVFLAKRMEFADGKLSAPSSTLAPAQAGTSLTTHDDISSPGEISPAAIEQAARRLAPHIGPIAPVLARKEAKRADSLRNLYELLAEHLVDPAERKRFLKAAGMQ
jgi:hypothetical protein